MRQYIDHENIVGIYLVRLVVIRERSEENELNASLTARLTLGALMYFCKICDRQIKLNLHL